MLPNATIHDVEAPIDPVFHQPPIPENAQPRVFSSYELVSELVKQNGSKGRIFMQKY